MPCLTEDTLCSENPAGRVQFPAEEETQMARVFHVALNPNGGMTVRLESVCEAAKTNQKLCLGLDISTGHSSRPSAG